ncbi:uncharacterized protein OCT59_027877 [Rhizophagus irregularis]|uniref:Uncharacterized protein n=2 Tax=Rhizophagus irregularis TaxID=588596 RepID=U9U577_RHIID|nr:hypothetical protein GLOIN_2v1503581 [Rhizophagus irregularis DAOM 181602=DAOM 197198]EXX67896.1 hypothetical protein RirG_110130 [Rhizophagus irregularis DAOM 197198w]POG81913.1 hypothetical protein GLOIN_2v1503581 [Rhizophagus irregularis DAOM 181602=DAOM 197198]UZO07596.1 hypothetical protein OCT59_027877 [Rhizophagus irregularis]|eukprot:XP_025188779.1 hypothetical protein GLOIN_2v1503581 [Rhizophagus irregularis DAOM 181602=DAOM 197198]
MRKHNLIVLIAIVIILCLTTLSNGSVIKSNLVKRKQDTPYTEGGGLYDYKNKKHKKKKHKNKNYSRHFINKRDDDVPEPDLGEVSVGQEEKANLQKRQTPPVSTGHVDASKTNPGQSGNP